MGDGRDLCCVETNFFVGVCRKIVSYEEILWRFEPYVFGFYDSDFAVEGREFLSGAHNYRLRRVELICVVKEDWELINIFIGESQVVWFLDEATFIFHI